MSYPRATWAIATHLALLTGVVHADEPVTPFPAYVDGHLVPTAEGEVHHASEQLDDDVKLAAATYCATHTNLLACALERSRPARGAWRGGQAECVFRARHHF